MVVGVQLYWPQNPNERWGTGGVEVCKDIPQCVTGDKNSF